MITPPLAPEEPQRLEALRNLNILDSGTEERFDRLTRLAARLFNVPTALVSLVDENRQWFKSCFGMDVREMPREISFCGHAILADRPFIIPDATQDLRFYDNPLVVGPPYIRFYAGIPLASKENLLLGTLCLIDHRPRDFDERDVANLVSLAGLLQEEINFMGSEVLTERLHDSEEEFSSAFNNALIGMALVAPSGRFRKVNRNLRDLLGFTEEEMLAKNWQEIAHPDDLEMDMRNVRLMMAGELDSCKVEKRYMSKAGEPIWVLTSVSMVRDSQGRPRHFICQVEDFRLRRQAEEDSNRRTSSLQEEMRLLSDAQRKLMESEAEHRALAIQIDDERKKLVIAQGVAQVGSWDATLPDGAMNWSDEMFKIFELAPEHGHPAVQSFLQLVHPDERERISEVIFGTPQAEPGRTEHRIVIPDGKIKFVEERWQTHFDEEGHVNRVIGICQDVTERRRAEEERDRLFNLSEDMLCITNFDGFFEQVNPAWTRSLGWTAEELRAVPWSEWVHPEDLPLTLQIASGLSEGKPLRDFENRYRCRDGAYRWLSWSCHPLVESKKVFAVVRDVTERRRNEEEMVLLNTCIEHLREVILITEALPFDEPGPVIVFANPAFEKITGYPTSEAIGRSPRFLQGEKTDRRTLNEIRDAIERQQPVHRKLLNYAKDGRSYWIEMDIVPIFDRAGKCTHFASIERDITEQEEKEEQLSWKTAFFEAQVYSSNDGILVLDREGKKIVQNARMAELWKIPETISGQDDDQAQLAWLAASMKDPESFLDRVHEINSHPDQASREEVELKDGAILDRYTYPVVGQDGTRYGRIWTFRDITDRKSAEAEMMNARIAAETANRTKSEFLATMSHEIRTPLNAIIGMTDLMLGTPMTGEQKDLLETVHSSGENLMTIVNDVLDFSKIEFGALELDTHAFNLQTMTQDVISMLNYRAATKNLVLASNIDPRLSREYEGDEARIRQVLINLVTNAIKFTETGQVRLEVRPAPASPEDPAGVQRLDFSVVDTGIGIPADRLDRLFKVFSQVDSSTTRRYGGSGLGLAICQRLVQLMGGEIKVESAAGAGSTFRFEIPLSLISAERQPASSRLQVSTRRLPPPPGRIPPPLPISILLVEDNLTNQKVAKQILKRIGYEAEVANNGLEAVEAVRKKKFDLIFMDLHMPIMDGLEATRHIRQMETDHRPKIVALTADVLKGERENCLAAGMDDYATKPIKIDLIKAIVLRIKTSTDT